MDPNSQARDNACLNCANAGLKAIWQRMMKVPQTLHRRLGAAQRQIAEAIDGFRLMRPEQEPMQRDLDGRWESSAIPTFVLEDIYWKP